MQRELRTNPSFNSRAKAFCPDLLSSFKMEGSHLVLFPSLRERETFRIAAEIERGELTPFWAALQGTHLLEKTLSVFIFLRC